MCNHYQNHPEALSTWAEYVGWDHPESPFSEIKIDVWPKYQGIVGRMSDGKKVLDTMQWGVPRTMPGTRPGTTVTKRITNVRNLTSPFWRAMLANQAQRCLVPFTRFAEPKPNAGREECWFKVTDAPSAAFAGIWRPSEEGHVFAFLTTDPNPLVKPIHPKAMPVILHPEDYERWLTADGADACSLAVPFPSQLMTLDDA